MFTVPAHVDGVAVIDMVTVVAVDFVWAMDNPVRPVPEQEQGMIMLFPLIPGPLA